MVGFVFGDTADPDPDPDAERSDTELGSVLVSPVEQSVLDLVTRPGLGDAESDVSSLLQWTEFEGIRASSSASVSVGGG